MLWLDLDEDKFIVDHKEVESVRWIDLEECIECVEKIYFVIILQQKNYKY